MEKDLEERTKELIRKGFKIDSKSTPMESASLLMEACFLIGDIQSRQSVEPAKSES